MTDLRAGLVARRYHVVLPGHEIRGYESGLLACDSNNWANAECELSQVPNELRCQRNGCRGRWSSGAGEVKR